MLQAERLPRGSRIGQKQKKARDARMCMYVIQKPQAATSPMLSVTGTPTLAPCAAGAMLIPISTGGPLKLDTFHLTPNPLS